MRLPLIIVALFFLQSCGHVITRESRLDLVADVPFKTITENPEPYFNKNFLLGGIIVETVILQSGSDIELVESPIDNSGFIIDEDVSSGRLLLHTDRKLDPAIYRPGRELTFVGTLTGTVEKKLGEVAYRYPVLTAKEVFLWKERIFRDDYIYPYNLWYPGYSYPYGWHSPYRPWRYYP